MYTYKQNLDYTRNWIIWYRPIKKILKWHIQADHADGGEIGTSLYFKTLTETTSLHAGLAENIDQVDGLMMSKTLDKRTNKLRLAKNWLRLWCPD